MRTGAAAILTIALGLTVLACGSSARASSAAVSPPGSAATAVIPSAPTERPASPLPSVVGPRTTIIPGAPDSGITLQLVAERSRWNVDTLNGPAGRIFRIELENRDASFLHNLVIAAKPRFPATIFGSKFLGIATKTFEIPGLPAGTYQFICSIHPDTMTGTLVIA
jgi:hypothetical protein